MEQELKETHLDQRQIPIFPTGKMQRNSFRHIAIIELSCYTHTTLNFQWISPRKTSPTGVGIQHEEKSKINANLSGKLLIRNISMTLQLWKETRGYLH